MVNSPLLDSVFFTNFHFQRFYIVHKCSDFFFLQILVIFFNYTRDIDFFPDHFSVGTALKKSDFFFLQLIC